MEKEQPKKMETSIMASAQELYRLYAVEQMPVKNICKKTGLSKSTVYKRLHIFEDVNPQMVEQMKKKSSDILPEDYRKLQEELSQLKKQLARESLRADIYEEMVKFGKEMYGIDLKKAGTK